jgi:hypothetical protein
MSQYRHPPLSTPKFTNTPNGTKQHTPHKSIPLVPSKLPIFHKPTNQNSHHNIVTTLMVHSPCLNNKPTECGTQHKLDTVFGTHYLK